MDLLGIKIHSVKYVYSFNQNRQFIQKEAFRQNRPRWTSDGRLICLKCNKPGHTAIKCRGPRRQETNNSVSQKQVRFQPVSRVNALEMQDSSEIPAQQQSNELQEEVHDLREQLQNLKGRL